MRKHTAARTRIPTTLPTMAPIILCGVATPESDEPEVEVESGRVVVGEGKASEAGLHQEESGQ